LTGARVRRPDLGTPIVIAEPEHPASVAYRAIAGHLAQQVSICSFGRLRSRSSRRLPRPTDPRATTPVEIESASRFEPRHHLG
jgi:hypothetical protein